MKPTRKTPPPPAPEPTISPSLREANEPVSQSEIGNRQSKRIKINLPPEFVGLSPVQLDYINDQLRTGTYADAQRMIFTDLGIQISINKLFRYYKKLELADQLEISEESNEAVEQLLNLYNGQPVDIDEAGLETLKRRALALAVSPSTKPSMLLNLLRIFTWEHRKSMDEHRKTVDAEKSAHRDRMAAIAERRAQCEEDRVKLLERRQTHTEKLKPAASDFPQEEITRLFEEQLSRPWSPPSPPLSETLAKTLAESPSDPSSPPPPDRPAK